MNDSAPRRLLAHLAQFSVFSRQGEPLCTRGLEHLLNHGDASGAFAHHIQSLVKEPALRFFGKLVWRAEVRQRDIAGPGLAGTLLSVSTEFRQLTGRDVFT